MRTNRHSDGRTTIYLNKRDREILVRAKMLLHDLGYHDSLAEDMSEGIERLLRQTSRSGQFIPDENNVIRSLMHSFSNVDSTNDD